ncbi:MAG: YabP/YqfC family sporulation protein [Clostridia bacterium]|nr:YabP/YqfC family sporulation protein [Clostridia bacterium]
MSKKIKLSKRRVKEKFKLFGAAMQLSSDPFSKLAQINLKGNREMIIDGCYGIIEYSDCLISINIGNSTLKLMGFDFTISDYSESNITVKGVIKSIEFC